MGRQDDLDRMRRFRHDQSPQEQVHATHSVPTPQPRVPRPQPSRSHPSKFSIWMMTLVGVALAVILMHPTSPMQWVFSPNGPFGNSQFLLTSASSIDASVPETGDRIAGFTVTQGWHSGHMGIDVALPNGQDSTGIPLYAIGFTDTDVEVICWYEPITGLNVSTYAAGMEFAFDYSHLNACATEPGQRVSVKAGQQIAEIGNTGAATTGPHLHFQQRQAGTENPITGTHVRGWRGYVEMSLLGKTLNPSGRLEEQDTAEPTPLVTPLPSSPRLPETAPPSPQMLPEGQQELFLVPHPDDPPPPNSEPLQTPDRSSGVLRSPLVYPPI
jgi:hypothetical protein